MITITRAEVDASAFWAKAGKGAPDDCWEWQGTRSAKDYGRIKVKGKDLLAHRVAWCIDRGDIPDGMLIDHRCHNHCCVNPSHLRIVTNKQNLENRSGPQRDGTSGIRGVTWMKDRSSWRAYAIHNGKLCWGGDFKDREDAEVSAIALRNSLFTHNDLDRKIE